MRDYAVAGGRSTPDGTEAMSIRRHLVFAFVCVLGINLVFGGLLAYFYARTKVGTEMQAAVSAGVHIVQNALDDTEEIVDPRRLLPLVMADFDGDRHLTASLLSENNVLLATSMPLAPEEPAHAQHARQPNLCDPRSAGWSAGLCQQRGQGRRTGRSCAHRCQGRPIYRA